MAESLSTDPPPRRFLPLLIYSRALSFAIRAAPPARSQQLQLFAHIVA